jgi:hypothetical protein
MAKQRRNETRVREARVAYAARGNESPRRKNHYLLQSKLDLARAVLGARTETEALDMALDMVIYGDALAAGTESLDNEEYLDILGLEDEVPG